MTLEQIVTELEGLEKAATEAPWRTGEDFLPARPDTICAIRTHESLKGDELWEADLCGNFMREEDYQYVVALRNNIKPLLQYLRASMGLEAAAKEIEMAEAADGHDCFSEHDEPAQIGWEPCDVCAARQQVRFALVQVSEARKEVEK